MATIVVTNIDTAPVNINDLYTTIPVGGSVTTERSTAQISSMAGLQQAAAASKVTVAVTLSADEIASGLAVTSGSVQAADVQPVAAADAAAATFEIRKSFTALAAGVVDDITIYAANALPFKMRITDVYALISTPGVAGAKTLTVRDQSGGLGTVVATIDDTAAGRISPTAFTASTVLTPGTLKGLFIRRDQRDVAGEIVIVARREV